MFQSLSDFALHRGSWLLLALSALVLESTALFFQHVMDLAPCVMCIYERVAMMGLIFAGLIGAINPKVLALRVVGYSMWAVSAIQGLLLSIEHVGYQFPKNPFIVTCGYQAEFPAWARLDDWFPSLFLPTGMCDEITWLFLNLTMPQWLIVCFGVYCALGLTVLASRIAYTRSV
ncbi:disulfide bond formation protein DsbB [Echinimonas agarilytica]|uniref:Disulfide bond formation protein B n=1 Tax=Echinimonas agarilytica TaxID=1215918 RepID=A0AA41W6F5_9GAMM|nr:disulfide bond formation protein DsbB [Echinimonas agarilytica]MCM2679439.1 disulfide bond formation protein DsbB [Echinimonas agarilytica]